MKDGKYLPGEAESQFGINTPEKRVALAKEMVRRDAVGYAEDALAECFEQSAGEAHDGGAFVFLCALMKCCERKHTEFVDHLVDEFMPVLEPGKQAVLTECRLAMHYSLKNATMLLRAMLIAKRQKQSGILPEDFRLRLQQRDAL